jgi:hypothetical protein
MFGPAKSLTRRAEQDYFYGRVEAKTGSGSRTRTYDPRINSPLLYQLSYAGVRRG